MRTDDHIIDLMRANPFPVRELMKLDLPTVTLFAVSDPQRYFMLEVRRGDLAAKLRPIMDAMGWPRASEDEKAKLRSEGYIRRDPKNPRYHVLLPKGLRLAETIMRDLARKFGVHQVTVREGFGTLGHSASCPCGWGTHAQLSGNGLSVVTHYAGDHMKQAAAGTLPEAYRMGAGDGA